MSFRRIALTTIALGASGSTTLIFNLFLARALSPSMFGAVSRTYALSMSVAQVTMTSIALALSRRVAHGETQLIRRQLARHAILILAVISLAVSLLFIPLALVGFAPANTVSLLLGTCLATIYATYFGLKSILFSLDWLTKYAALEISSDIIFLGALIALSLIAPEAAVASFSIAYGVFVFRCIRLLRKDVQTQKFAVNREFVGYSSYSFIGAYAFIARFPLAVSLTGLVGTSVESGKIAVVIAIVMPLFLLPQAISMLTFAQVARARGADESKTIRTTVRIVAAGAGLASIVAVAVAHPVLSVVLGSRYSSMTSSFLLLVICLFPQLAAMPVGNAMAAEGGVVLKAALSVAGLVIAALGVILLVPSMGAKGAAYALDASALITGWFSLGFGRYYYRLGLKDIREGLLLTIAAAIIFGATMGGIA
jgi:O-antigen/teichoic acid export membrane protein